MAEEGAIAKQLRHWRDTGCKRRLRPRACGSSSPSLASPASCIPKADGGLGLGHVEAGIVLEEIGRNLTPSPFLTTAVAGVARARRARRMRERWFPGILAGDTVAALAIDEGQASRPGGDRDARPSAQGNGFVLNGAKQFVVQGASADVILVAARTADRRARPTA